MPRLWYDRHSVNKVKDGAAKSFYRSVVADKKPYFMRYIYPSLMKEYNTYIKSTNRNALREFHMTVEEMMAVPYEELSERQREFLRRYNYKLPVGTGNCVMNKICRRFEDEFDGHIKRHNSKIKFNSAIMKRNNVEYVSKQFYAVKRLYENYNNRLRQYKILENYEYCGDDELSSKIYMLDAEFRAECNKISPNQRVLCNIILDLCYRKNSTKKFAWSMCRHEIIHNLLANNNNKISFPVLDENGDIKYGGETYSIKTKELEVNE